MSMASWTLAKKELRLLLRDYRALMILLAMPLIFILVLGLFQTATLVRYTRASMLENLPQDYVRTARAKGLAEASVIVRARNKRCAAAAGVDHHRAQAKTREVNGCGESGGACAPAADCAP